MKASLAGPRAWLASCLALTVTKAAMLSPGQTSRHPSISHKKVNTNTDKTNIHFASLTQFLMLHRLRDVG